ncbi:SDR family oxidoreductase [Sporichthya sp.]|uniref:SDR family NAD(P)-dependent oxidoreductase n=1 Tax=Sporichthya sp. TaxID=65475 RepID=UPI0017F5A53C|nr:SDR family oxidoreductase [Sporichthya sp.]MBA3741415.1 SDR family oxidoreductase [Sporichthya sp.]
MTHAHLLEGRVAVITGGASGLGRATAELFAEHGAKVVVADVHDQRGAETVQAIEKRGGGATYLHTNVAVADEVRAVVQMAEDTYGKLDIMVANAGIAGPQKHLEDVDDDEMRLVFDVNFLGIWRAFKYAAPAIRRAGGGSMTSTSAVSGVYTMGGIKRGVYTATKRATNVMTSYFATELAPDRIRVNCVAPGGMSTNITENYGIPQAASAAAPPPLPTRKLREFGTANYPICDPLEVAQVHLFLNSDLASFVNGEVIVADGGGFSTTVAAFFPQALTGESQQ